MSILHQEPWPQQMALVTPGRCHLLTRVLTELDVLVVREHQDDVGADVSAVPLKPAFQAVVRQEGGALAQQRENRCGEQAQQEAGAGHFLFLLIRGFLQEAGVCSCVWWARFFALFPLCSRI